MKKITKFLSVAALLAITLITSSCQKEVSHENPTASTKSLLIAKTWQVEQVTEVANGASILEYKRGAENNIEDYSKMRFTFKGDGTMIFIDDAGEELNNALYELLDNNKKIKMTVDGFPVLAEDVMITANQFSFKMQNFDESYALYILTPAL